MCFVGLSPPGGEREAWVWALLEGEGRRRFGPFMEMEDRCGLGSLLVGEKGRELDPLLEQKGRRCWYAHGFRLFVRNN